MNEHYQAAKEYLSYGFNPIPREKSKKPAISWESHQYERILPSTLELLNQILRIHQDESYFQSITKNKNAKKEA